MNKFLIGLCGLLTLSLILAQPSIAKDSKAVFTKEQVNSIETIVHSYLIAHPEVLKEAANALQRQQMIEMQKKTIDVVRKNREQVLRAQDDIILGNKNGKITLVQFFDYQCPYCSQMVPDMNNIIKKNPNLRVVFKDFIIHGANSKLAAMAAMAVYKIDPSKYIAFHDALLDSKQPLTSDNILNLAKQQGIPTKQLKTLMNDPNILKTLKDNFQLSIQLQLIGTPSFIIAKTDMPNDSQDQIYLIPGMTNEAEIQQELDALKQQQ